MYSLYSKLFTNYTLTIHWGVQNPTQNGAQTLHKTARKPYTKLCTKNSTFCFLNTNHAKGASVLLVVATRVATLCKCVVSCGDASRFASKIFHTQGGFSVLTLLAFGDEKYYICTEIWEEPRLPPFFRHFPFKIGDFRSAFGKNLPSPNLNLPSSNFN